MFYGCNAEMKENLLAVCTLNDASWPGLSPGIHVLYAASTTWMAGTSQDKPGHDEAKTSREAKR